MFGELDFDKAFIELNPLIDDAKHMVDCLDQWSKRIQQNMRQTNLSERDRETLYSEGKHHMIDTRRGRYQEIYVDFRQGKVVEQYKSKDFDWVGYQYNDVSWSVDGKGRLKYLKCEDKYYIWRSKNHRLKNLIIETL